VSVEGGMTGEQRRFVCTKCGKIFFAWRPDTAPGVKVKCYFCKNEMEDDASRRVPAVPAAPPPGSAPAPAESAAPADDSTPPS
jgi:hypothetical protein